jgi:hypothetical protein
MIEENEVLEEHVSEAIYVYRNTLSDTLCDKIWNFYYENSQYLTPGVTAGGLIPDTKNTMDFFKNENSFPTQELVQEFIGLNEEVYQSLLKATQMYIKRYDWLNKCPNLVDTHYLWQGYRQGEGFYQEHIDGENWSPKVVERVIAVIAYINTVEEGGETYFRHQNVSLKPVKGSVCLFPTTWQYPHQAYTPISSDKLILSSFIISPQG